MHPDVFYRFRRAIVLIALIIIGSWGWPGAALIAETAGPSSKHFQIDGTSFESMVFESHMHIRITATGIAQNRPASAARIKIMAMPDIEVLSEEVSLKNG
jgi:hypothetical protein